MASEIKMSPEELMEKADAASSSIGKMRDRLRELGVVIKRTSHYWIGDAGEQHRKTYSEQEKTQEEIMKRLSRHPNNMLAIAGVFQDAEKKSVESAAELPVDIF